MQKAKERLYFTADKDRLVGAGDKRAAFLYAAIGDEIPNDAAARFGLVDGLLKSTKGKPANEDKERKGGGNKGAADDLTKVKGVGAAIAAALAAAGITSFAQIAAIDPANPPVVVLGNARADWAGWVEGAKALLPPEQE